MVKKRLTKLIGRIGPHGYLLCKGFARVLYSVIIAGLAYTATNGFARVLTMRGYTAVFVFLLSTLAMLVALGGIYLMGGHPEKEVKK